MEPGKKFNPREFPDKPEWMRGSFTDSRRRDFLRRRSPRIRLLREMRGVRTGTGFRGIPALTNPTVAYYDALGAPPFGLEPGTAGSLQGTPFHSGFQRTFTTLRFLALLFTNSKCELSSCTPDQFE
ncbi:hypothetical protein SAMN05216428_10386 [Nitrosospira sp. Nsp11]|nr:hypothetical protein SAMN05216428_10386 [Nitrosospira sp. Nsp11]